MFLAPIALFAYDRLSHLRQTVESLKENDFAKDSDIFIFSDGPRGNSSVSKVEEVREYLTKIDGFKNIKIIKRESNFGLAKSIISSVTEVLELYGKVIVLEDDIVTSPFFLKFMNASLELYEKEEKVISIHGYIYPVESKLPETFFIRGADCWGWATWKRGWDLFENNGSLLFEELKKRNLMKAFDFNGTYPFTEMLKAQIVGENNSWAIRWYASAFLNNKLTLYPGRSLVCNIGNEGSGTHCGVNYSYDVTLAQTAIDVKGIEVSENGDARKAFEEFFQTQKSSFFIRLKLKIKEILWR